MILAVIPLIPVAYVAGVAAIGGIVGWMKCRKLRKEESKAQAKIDTLNQRLAVIAAKQQQHEDDLNGVIANLETGQTAEEVEFGIFPKKYKIKEIKDDKVDDRFELLDL